MSKKPRVLVCDDNHLFREALKISLSDKYDISCVTDAEQAVEHVKLHCVDVVLLDVQIRTSDEGLRYIPLIKKADPDVAIIMSSGVSDFDSVREAMKQGAADYVPKGASHLDLIVSLERVMRLRDSQLRRAQQNSEVASYHNRHVLVGESRALENLRRTIEKVRNSTANVIITGEPGVGKEVVARSLRGNSPDGTLLPFVAVDSSTIQSTTAESVLFGHEKGAFTGADKPRKGLFEEADGGIIYFDEIGNMTLDIQAKLLRVVQEKEVARMGSSKQIQLEFRVVAATNQNMEKMVENREFRYDLLSRLSVIPIHIPPLRERREDIPLLISYFLGRSGSAVKFSPEAMEMLQRYAWPGNIRELGNLVAYVTTMCESDTVDVLDLPAKILTKTVDEAAVALPVAADGTFYDRVKGYEKELLARELVRVGNNIAQLARDLGMDRSHLYAKLKSFGLHGVK